MDDFQNINNIEPAKIPEELTPGDVTENPDEMIREASADISKSIQETIDPGADDVMANLVLDGKIENSVYLDHVVNFFNFLGKKLKICIQVGSEKMFPENEGNHVLQVGPHTINSFTKKAGVMIAAMSLGSGAAAQSFEGSEDAHSFTNWPLIISVLAMLGISTVVAIKLLRKSKKETSNTKEKASDAAKDYFEEFEKAKTPEEKAKAKEKIIDTTQGEINDEDLNVQKESIKEISKEEFYSALDIKSQTDHLIQEEIEMFKYVENTDDSLTAKASPGEILKEKSKQVENGINISVKKLKNAYNNLKNKSDKLADATYLKIQHLVEMKKLEYIISYFKLLKKKWAISFEEEKIKLENGEKNLADEHHEIKEDIKNLQTELNDLMDKQSGFSDQKEFEQELGKIEEKLEQEIQNAKINNVLIEEESEKAEVGMDTIIFENKGKYEAPDAVQYTIKKMDGSTQDVSIELTQENCVVQLWLNSKNEIQFNFSEKYSDSENHEKLNIIDSQVLKIGDKDLLLSDTGKNLSEHLKTLQYTKHEEPSLEIPAESAETLADISGKVENIKQSPEERLIGEYVELDDDAIEFQQVKIHREFHDGKQCTVVKLVLNESYWKAALENLKKYSDIPKQSISFNFEDKQKNVAYVQQPAIRFNILKNGKLTPVIIPSDGKTRSMQGEVRIIFEDGQNYSESEIQECVLETGKKLGIQNHLVPTTNKSRQAEIERLKERRRWKTANTNPYVVNDEYNTKAADFEEVEQMKKDGLFCIYTQFYPKHFEEICEARNLFSTSTRYSKGILQHGMSSMSDFTNGGAKSVFTRIHTKNSQKNDIWYSDKPALIFPPGLLSRMDCYAYTSDLFGSLAESTYKNRVSPQKLLQTMNAHYSDKNEIMFQDAICMEKAKYLVCNNPAEYIEKLEQAGFTELGGNPLNKAVITRQQFTKLSDI